MKTEKSERKEARNECNENLKNDIPPTATITLGDFRFVSDLLDDIDEPQARCEELKGLYDAEYNHTQSLRAKCEWQAGMLNEAKRIFTTLDGPGASEWLSNLASAQEGKAK